MLCKSLIKKSDLSCMRKINCFVCLIILVTYLTSCQTNNNNEIIHLKDVKTKNVEISSIADSIYYIALETKEECFIKSIKQIKFTEDKIFILDGWKKILIFSKEGAFLNKINNRGKGPGEYRRISDFALNPKENTVYLLDDHEILGYDYWGNYKHYKIKINNYNTFHFHDNHFYCHAPVVIHGKNQNYKLDVIDMEGSVIQSYLPVKKDNTSKSRFISFGKFYTLNEKVFLLEPGKNTIYKVDTNSIKQKYQFIYENNKNERRKLSSKQILESPNMVLYHYTIENQWNLLYIDKKNKHKINVKTAENKAAFENDILNDKPIRPRFIEGNLLIELVYPHNFKKYIKSNKTQYKEYMDINDFSVGDNPIIRIIELK